MTKHEFDVSIDKFRLDEEWVNQPEFYHRYALKLSESKTDADEAKNMLEVVRAELHQKISKNPEKYDIPKVTVDAVNNAIVLQSAYRDAQDEVVSTRNDVLVLEAAVNALDQRKRALEKLVDLHLADYFAKPVATGASAEAVRDIKKTASRSRTRIRRSEQQ